MPGQARIGDLVIGCSLGVIVTGSPNVKTNNRKSARAISDLVLYSCGCGICFTHSPDVKINNLWSHRQFDLVMDCCTPPCSSIFGITVTGSPNVKVNG